MLLRIFTWVALITMLVSWNEAMGWPGYAEMARKRIYDDSPLMARVELER